MRKEISIAEPELKKICYVCLKPFKTEAVYIGKGVYRHESCSPGTVRWLKSEVGRQSDLRKYFEEGDEQNES